MEKKFVRCIIRGEERQGLVADGAVYALNAPMGDGAEPGVRLGTLDEVERYLPPTSPTKVVAVGLNYRDHATEVGLPIPEEPLLFLKPPTSVVGHGEPVIYPGVMTKRVDYEAELGIVIGKRCRSVPPEDALG